MSSQKKGKDDDKKSSKEKGTAKFSKYEPLEESESSESEKLPIPPADQQMEQSTSAAASNLRSRGAVVRLPSSRSWTDTSCRTLTVTDTKGARRSQSIEKSLFKPSSKSAGSTKARKTSRSPFKGLIGKAKSQTRSRSESKSPLKKLQETLLRARKVEEKRTLLDHPDGDRRVVEKPKPPVEIPRGEERLTNKDLTLPDHDRIPDPDEESTSRSSVSEASSVSRSTQNLSIDPDDDESKQIGARGRTLRSASARVILPPKSSVDSDQESKSSNDSDKETKSKRKKK